MISVRSGDLFKSRAQTLVNTVNCVGIMGKGIALEFKRRFPEMFKDYVGRCRKGGIKLGEPYLFKRPERLWILNFPTKEHWRSVARLEDIVRGLEVLERRYRAWGITSLAVPPLGCGLGQLDWKVVGPTLYRYLSRLDVPVELYAPHGTPAEQLGLDFLDSSSGGQVTTSRQSKEWIPPGWVALAEILDRIERQPYHWPIGRVTFQKIAYVATEEGLPTGLTHTRGSYGPFSPEVKKMIAKLVNNGVLRETRLGQMFSVQAGSTFADARKAYATDLLTWEPIIEKTTDLFMRLNTRLAELVATVLFAGRELERSSKRPTERQVIDAVLNWKQRRQPALDEALVARTVRNLAVLGWLRVSGTETLDDEFVIEKGPPGSGHSQPTSRVGALRKARRAS